MGNRILLSASWGALPFPLQKNGVLPISAPVYCATATILSTSSRTTRDWGVASFVDRVLDPLSPESCSGRGVRGRGRLTELRLSRRDSERVCEVLAVDEAYRDQVDVSGGQIVVEHTIRLDGRDASGDFPGRCS